MKCPLCTVDLIMSERQGIEIDYCPKCRGVWLDRGELDKIIEKSTAAQPAIAEPQGHQPYRGGHQGKHDDHAYGKHRRRSFLGELFD